MFVSKLSPEQWAEARRLHASGEAHGAIAKRLGVNRDTIGNRARKEGWPSPRDPSSSARLAKVPRASPATAGIRSRLALRLYSVIDFRIRMMEPRMLKQLQAYQRDEGGSEPPAPSKDERETFAALIESINQVTEIASEPAATADGGRNSANPELTRLSDDIDPDGLAIASKKDAFRREIAERLGKLFPPA